jgi:3-aminobutyryl-CoA ammonia-lyase
MKVTHRRYVPHGHAHYAGNLVDGAYALGLFGDAATELCIRHDGDEGLFAAYGDVQFKAPVRGGDVLEVTATLLRAGNRSRTLAFECVVQCRDAAVLDPPIVAVTATGTVVVPAR